MKTLLRYFLINFAAIWLTARIVPGFIYDGELRTLLLAVLAFALINMLLVPILKVLLLPLNLLTLGLFAWVVNVLALYALTRVVPGIQITPFYFPGANLGGITLPTADISTFWSAMLASLVIGLVTHFFHWLSH